MAANRRCAAFVRDVFVDWEIMNVPFTEVAVATDSASTGSYQVDRNFGRPVRYFLRELEAAEDVLVPRSRPKVGDCLIALRWLSCKREDSNGQRRDLKVQIRRRPRYLRRQPEEARKLRRAASTRGRNSITSGPTPTNKQTKNEFRKSFSQNE
jgi:hypothetical protein